MKIYGTITEEGSRVEHLDHTVKLMRTEKEVKINEVYEKIKHCKHMTVEARYLEAISHTIKLIRTWENERLSIVYTDNAKPLMGIDFEYDDIVGISKRDEMYEQIVIELKDGVNILLA